MPMARLSRESRMWHRESTLRYPDRGQGRISHDTTRMRYVMMVLLHVGVYGEFPRYFPSFSAPSNGCKCREAVGRVLSGVVTCISSVAS